MYFYPLPSTHTVFLLISFCAYILMDKGASTHHPFIPYSFFILFTLSLHHQLLITDTWKDILADTRKALPSPLSMLWRLLWFLLTGSTFSVRLSKDFLWTQQCVQLKYEVGKRRTTE